jgi:predicted dehydrogenase
VTTPAVAAATIPLVARAALARVLVVGFGSIGARHARVVRALHPDAAIAVLRSTPGRAGVDAPGLVPVADLDAAIAFAPTVAVIASPATHHAATAVRLIEAGVPLLVEKPLAADVGDAHAIAEAAARRGTIVATGYNLRFAPGLRWLHERLGAGVIGPVRTARAEVGQYLPDWRPGHDYREGVSARRALGGGALLELSHELDYLVWLLGSPRAVSAMLARTSDLAIDDEDCAQLALRFDGEDGRPLLASATLDFVRRDPRRRCTLVGRGGTLEWDGITGRCTHVDAAAGLVEERLLPVSDRDATYRGEWTDLAEAIVMGRAPAVDAGAGARIVALVAAARCAAAEGRTVLLDDAVQGAA